MRARTAAFTPLPSADQVVPFHLATLLADTTPAVVKEGDLAPYQELAYLTTPLARWCALRWGAITAVRDRDVHAIPTPRLGGMAIFTVGGLLSSLDSYSALKSVAVVMRLIFLTVFWFWLGTVVLRRKA